MEDLSMPFSIWPINTLFQENGDRKCKCRLRGMLPYRDTRELPVTMWRVRQFITSWIPSRDALIASGDIEDEAVGPRTNLASSREFEALDSRMKYCSFTFSILFVAFLLYFRNHPLIHYLRIQHSSVKAYTSRQNIITIYFRDGIN